MIQPSYSTIVLEAINPKENGQSAAEVQLATKLTNIGYAIALSEKERVPQTEC